MFSFFETATKRSFPQKGSFWKQGERCSHFADPRSFKGLWSAFGDWTCWKSIWLQFVPANWISRDTYWYQNPGIVWLSSIDPGFIRLCLSILYLWKDFAKDGRAPRVSEALPLVISSYDILICNLSNRKCVKFGVFRQISNDLLSKMMKFPFMKLAYPFENKRALLSLKPGRFPCITWVGCCQWFRPVGGGTKDEHSWLGVGRWFTRWWCQRCFGIFTPIFGGMIQFDEHIFQMGGSTTN